MTGEASEPLPRFDELFEISWRGYDRSQVEAALPVLGDAVKAASAEAEAAEDALRRLQVEGPGAPVDVPLPADRRAAVPTEFPLAFRGYQREQVDDYVTWLAEVLAGHRERVLHVRDEIARLRAGGAG